MFSHFKHLYICFIYIISFSFFFFFLLVKDIFKFRAAVCGDQGMIGAWMELAVWAQQGSKHRDRGN